MKCFGSSSLLVVCLMTMMVDLASAVKGERRVLQVGKAPAPKDPKAKDAKVDCLALAKGELPKAFDNSVKGVLSVDVTYDSTPKEVLLEVAEVLQTNISAAVAGCDGPLPPPPAPKGRRLANATVAVNDTAPTILGVNFSNIVIGDACKPVNKTWNCSEVTSDVTILYDGEANATEQAAMFDLLKAAIEAQGGSFDSVEVDRSSTLGSGTNGGSAQKSGQPKSTSVSAATAMAASVVTAILCLIQL